MEGLWGEGQGLGPVERNPMVCLIASGGWLQVWMDVAWEMEFSPPPTTGTTDYVGNICYPQLHCSPVAGISWFYWDRKGSALVTMFHEVG